MAVPSALVRVPSQRPLALSVALVTSVSDDEGDNEMILGDVHTSSGICLTAEESPGKLQLGDRLMKAMRPVSASNGVPYLQMRSVGSHSESGRKCRLDAPRPAVPVNRRTWKVSITLLATSSGHVQYYRNKTKSLAPVLDPATSYPYSEQIFRRPSGACRSACSGVYKPASRQTDLVIDII